MIALTLAVLFSTLAVVTLLSLIDSWLRGRSTFAALKRERALAKAGFVPMVEAQETRLRDIHRTSRAANRSLIRRLPQARRRPAPEPAFFAA